MHKYHKEATDELTVEILRRADALCLKLMIAAAAIIAFAGAVGAFGRENHGVCARGNHIHFGSRSICGFLHNGSQGGLTTALKTKIREYREAAGLKQTDLAQLVQVRRETIVHLENGRYNPSLKLAMDIAKVFSVSVEELFSFTEDEI